MFQRFEVKFVCVHILNQFVFCIFIFAISPVLFFISLIIRIRILLSSNIKKILNALSCTYTVYDIETNVGNNVIFCLKIQGKLDVHKALETITKFVYQKSKENGQLLFPELQMYWIRWFGFPIWKFQNNFSVTNHVFRAVIPEGNDEDEFVFKFERNLVRKPFNAKQSPWEIALIDGKSDWYWLFKFHHSLADGQSVFKALMTCSDNYVPLYEPKIQNLQLFDKIFKIVTYPFIGWYEWMQFLLDNSHPNIWKMPVNQMSSDSRIVVISSPIPCSKITKILGSVNNSSFTSVLLAGISGGIHNVFKQQGKIIPDSILTRLPVPAPTKNPRGLTNNFTAVFMKLPIGVGDFVLRIKMCEKEIEMVKNSTISLTAFLRTNLMGSLPNWLQKQFPSSFQAVQISNFPGPKELICIGNQPVLDMNFILWSTQRNPMHLAVLSYNGNVRLVANVDPNLFPSEKLLKVFVREFEKQFE